MNKLNMNILRTSAIIYLCLFIFAACFIGCNNSPKALPNAFSDELTTFENCLVYYGPWDNPNTVDKA